MAMENHFQDTPVEAIILIAKCLDMKSLCNFIMSSKEFKSLCDTNDIWKYHYLKTIQNKWKITEDSVHIGGHHKKMQTYQYEFNDGFGENFMVTSYQSPVSYRIGSSNSMIWDYRKNVKFIKELGCIPFIYYRNGICHGCMKSQESDIVQADFAYNYDSDEDLDEWRSDICKKWKTFNESKGLKNLCQDPTHYDKNTLEIPSSCKGFKNYKKVVVKKMLTARKGNRVEKQYNKRIINTKYRMGILRQRMRNEKNELTLFKGYVEKEKEKTKRLQDAADCM